MLKAELLEIIGNGENSGVEFKRDDVRPEQLAKEIVAFANFQGGRILLGVDDDGTISGIQRPDLQEWVLNVFRDKVIPQIIPFYEEIPLDDKVQVAVITIAQGIGKPFVVRHNNREDIYIRMANRSELATREQQARLFASGGMLHVEVFPVAGTSLESLDLSRITYYLHSIFNDMQTPDLNDSTGWKERLSGLGLMADDGLGNIVCSIAGLVCFGKTPGRYLRQSGLRLMCFDGKDKSYRALLDTKIEGPLVGRWEEQNGQRVLVDQGLIEKFTTLIHPFVTLEGAEIDEGMRRTTSWYYPWEAIRETVINALVHRDWTRSVDIEVTCYSDRMEVISPGKLQNSMTITKMLAGQRSPRNSLIVAILKDYGYVDARGMGVRTKVVPLMKQHNNTEPIFELTDDYLKTILLKKKPLA